MFRGAPGPGHVNTFPLKRKKKMKKGKKEKKEEKEGKKGKKEV